MKFISSSLFYLLFIGFLNAQTVTLDLFASGFNDPVDLQNAGDDRVFVVEQGGRIKIVDPSGTTNATPFLNISAQVSTGSEQGLLGLAFHPDYLNNGYYYVNYTKTNGDSRIARFSVDPGDPDISLPGSELTIIEYVQPFSNHNGGAIAFGPDGYLYIGTGDGGSRGDPGNRAQSLNTLLGKLLRIDIDNPGGGNNYGIPVDNPFVSDPNALDEIWAYGLRNPWRFSFDSLTGDLWIGDVGQGDVEEVDRALSTDAGLNYGWRCYEGSEPYNMSGCPDPSELTFPIAEYSSSPGSGNCSVTGGYVNRSAEWPEEFGLYYMADYCSGRIWTVDNTGLTVDHGTFGGSWSSFGEDVLGQLYIVNLGGNIFKIGGTLIGTPDFDKSNVSILPNPASENVLFSIENDQILSIYIYDLRGSLIISEENQIAAEKSINVGDLSDGLYLVRVISEKGKSLVKKLVIE